ncbi:MAG TPA: tRNA (adenosine(37)-N6)-threonylcarbamoyltransferase complex ATPase subunit type 1 TsaE [Candidatus Paceibacterota bacterium]|nr:tRNA (adenosine(37)-N6)-threonylcarbamoyltransferase complex ATPase subunit type 1 TsaE [Candidatus Paceibacterota bacterium]
MERITLSGLPETAKTVLEKIPEKTDGAAVLALSGDLGAGKTTFVQALARELGIQETVQSPTYVLMKSYPIAYKQFTTLIHIDAYRLEKPEEFAALKPDIFLADPTNLVCIEWPEKAGTALAKPDLLLKFSSEGAQEGERYISIEQE